MAEGFGEGREAGGGGRFPCGVGTRGTPAHTFGDLSRLLDACLRMLKDGRAGALSSQGRAGYIGF